MFPYRAVTLDGHNYQAGMEKTVRRHAMDARQAVWPRHDQLSLQAETLINMQMLLIMVVE
jgi:hypothetical protein